MSRRLEIFIGLVIIISLLSFIGMNVFDTIFDKDATIAKLGEAIESMDMNYLKKHIEIEGSNNALDDDELTKIAKILKDEYIDEELKSSHKLDDENIYLKKVGREKIFFNKYILVLRPYKLLLESDMPGAKIFINGNEIGSFGEDSRELTYPGLLPGLHKIKILYKGEYVDLEAEDEIYCFDRYDNNVYAYLDLNPDFVEIYSNEENAILYINGKQTDIKLSEPYDLGPVPMDGSIKIFAQASVDGKPYKSQELTIDDYNYYYDLYIDYDKVKESEKELKNDQLSENTLTDIKYLIDAYEHTMVEAINYSEYAYVEDYIKSGSPLEKAQKDLVNRLGSKGTSEELLDYTILDISQLSDGLYEVTVSEEHDIFHSDGTSNRVSNTWKYTIVDVDGDLYLSELK